MAKEDVIRGVVCPDCGKEMYRHVVNNSKNNESFIYYDWRCVDCVYTYSELWLKDPKFNDFQDLVCSYEDGRDKLDKLLAFREEYVLEFEKSNLSFKNWFKKNKGLFDRFKFVKK